MRIAVVIGNPKPGSRTLSAALAVAEATQATLGISERLVIDLDHVRWPPTDPPPRRGAGLQEARTARSATKVTSGCTCSPAGYDCDSASSTSS